MPDSKPDYTSRRSGRFRLIHLSDPHLTSLSGVGYRELTNKRIIGYLSWYLRRRRAHRPEILELLRKDMETMDPDHIVVTGDLTQLGTSSECLQANEWLKCLGPPESVSVIPGNHDRYAPADWSETVGRWSEYLPEDVDRVELSVAEIFPGLRCRGQIALIGLSTAVPALPFLATGRLGKVQLDRFDRLLQSTREKGMFRVVLLHHGPVPGTNSYRRRLEDADEFCRLLRSGGAELVLHGHGHRAYHGFIPSPSSAIPVFGVPSASSYSDVPEKRAAYNIYDITVEASGFVLQAWTRVYDISTGSFTARQITKTTVAMKQPSDRA